MSEGPPELAAARIAQLESHNTALRNELKTLSDSLGLRLVRRYWASREAVLPPGTRRGTAYRVLKHWVRSALVAREPAAAPAPPALALARRSPPWASALTSASRESQGERLLIIAELTVPQCQRYRVDQKVEMLQALGHDVTVVPWQDDERCWSALQLHRRVVFYRTPGVASVLGLVAEAKRLGLQPRFEVDDLIFDEAEYRRNSNVARLPLEEQQALFRGAGLYRAALLACGDGIAATPALARFMAGATGRDVPVLPNALDRRALRWAEALARHPPARARDTVVVGYGSGTRTHDADFEVAQDALLAVLDAHPQVRLAIHGYLELPAAFQRVADRVYRLPYLEPEDYVAALASWDVSLAPLEPSAFNDAKSDIKWIEASVLGVPSVCSSSETYRGTVEHGRTGFLAASTEEWRAALTELVRDPGLRARVGAAAREAVLRRYHPDVVQARDVAPLFPAPRGPAAPALRVLEVNVRFAPFTHGGATVVVEAMARGLKARGCEVTVFAGVESAELAPYALARYEHDGIPVLAVRLPEGEHPSLDDDNPRLQAQFADVLRTVRPDVVHLHSIQRMGLGLARACADAHVPYVVTLHDAWWLCERQFLVMPDGRPCGQHTVELRTCSRCVAEPKRLYPRARAMREALEGAAALLAPSAFQRDFYAANGLDPERLRVHRNGVRVPSGARARRSAGAPVRLAYLGARSAHKGYAWLQALMREIPESNYVLRLTESPFVAPSERLRESEWRVAGRVEIVPPFDPSQVDAFYRDVDVLLYPSQWPEAFGLAVREATLRGIWVIATDAGGAAEDLRDGVEGNVIARGDAVAFREAIQAILRAPEKLDAPRPPPQARTFRDQADELHAALMEVTQPPTCEANRRAVEPTSPRQA